MSEEKVLYEIGQARTDKEFLKRVLACLQEHPSAAQAVTAPIWRGTLALRMTA